ncbi:MAG: hypothetical protein A3F33_03500 [Candidatus Woykebacteria bacterium RIFCSPHIGHO2_12_FULL_43_10]|uniref:DUF3465 domain-containing protein n=1 Tax=Candidatus Woykebacteria bacterium RIFCSPLOWO2_01_FULL_43_14 TaxID=1802605 RepID=A0A1G1WTN0_9BACT|nr:MAG: hypothetical protein A3F33_03500 [Candidatus Woykebacteria bacterium RIFCSPHIGHO2_12_FULL_43_10]OGY31075.1 MAG: hypothetical protein A3A61_03460 [Candidatus Woykebacteria bacterium RIFCSPLOWO2_01_FULL_43_14]
MSEETEITSEEAYKKRYDSVLLTARGVIAKVLTDDKEGSTHQRFILTTPSKQTLLILNNLERSYRLPIETGQNVEVKGLYRWNDLGGLIHETHHDSRATHQDGWIILTDINKRNSPKQ